MSLTNIAKTILDSDLKNMVKVGWLNKDLSLTEEGRDVVISRYFAKNKTIFGEMAKELLEEGKKEKKESK